MPDRLPPSLAEIEALAERALETIPRQLKRQLGQVVIRVEEFPDEDSLVRQALWYCDMTTGPDGRPVSFDERLSEIEVRYGPDHLVPRGIRTAEAEIRAAIAAVTTAVAGTG